MAGRDRHAVPTTQTGGWINLLKQQIHSSIASDVFPGYLAGGKWKVTLLGACSYLFKIKRLRETSPESKPFI